MFLGQPQRPFPRNLKMQPQLPFRISLASAVGDIHLTLLPNALSARPHFITRRRRPSACATYAHWLRSVPGFLRLRAEPLPNDVANSFRWAWFADASAF